VTLPLAIGTIALACGYVAAGLARSLPAFALAQGALIGFGSAASSGPLIADISHWFERRRGIAVAICAAGLILMAMLGGMALGGWMSGFIFDLTGSYRIAFLNGLAWNLLNGSIVLWLLLRRGRRPLARTPASALA
jgi:MFS family permease